jgi:uncharacterized protein YerC
MTGNCEPVVDYLDKLNKHLATLHGRARNAEAAVINQWVQDNPDWADAKFLNNESAPETEPTPSRVGRDSGLLSDDIGPPMRRGGYFGAGTPKSRAYRMLRLELIREGKAHHRIIDIPDHQPPPPKWDEDDEIKPLAAISFLDLHPEADVILPLRVGGAYDKYLARNHLPNTTANRRHFCRAYTEYLYPKSGRGSGLACPSRKLVPLLQLVPEPTQLYAPGVKKAVLDKVIEYAKAKGCDDPSEEAIHLLWAVMHRASITQQWTINTKTGAVALRRSRAVWARFQRSKPPSVDVVDAGMSHDQHDELDGHPWDNLPSIFDTPYTGVQRRRSVDKGAAFRCSVWPVHRKKYQEARPRLKHAGGLDAQWDWYREKLWKCAGWGRDEGLIHWAMTNTDASVSAIARSFGKTDQDVTTINEQAIELLNKGIRNEQIVAMLAAGASYKRVQEATGLSHSTVARIRKEAREAEVDVRIYPATIVELRFEPFEQIIEPWAYGWELKEYDRNDESTWATEKFWDNSRFAAQALGDLSNSPGCWRLRFREDDMPPLLPPEEAREAPAVLMLSGGHAIGTRDGIRRVIGTRDGIRFIRPASARDERDPRIVAWQVEHGADEVTKRILYGTAPADVDDDRPDLVERFLRQDDGSYVPLPSPPRTRATATMLRLVRPLRRRCP